MAPQRRGTGAGNRHHLPLHPARLSPGWDVLNLMPLPRIPQGREVTQPREPGFLRQMWGGAPGGEVTGGGAAESAWSQKRAGPGEGGLLRAGPPLPGAGTRGLPLHLLRQSILGSSPAAPSSFLLLSLEGPLGLSCPWSCRPHFPGIHAGG